MRIKYFNNPVWRVKIKQLHSLILFSDVFLSTYTQPNDNTYVTAHSTSSHWTNALPWANVHSLLSYGAVANDNQDDLAVVTTLLISYQPVARVCSFKRKLSDLA